MAGLLGYGIFYLCQNESSRNTQKELQQHLDRGIKEITAYCEQNNLELEKIFTDQQTGRNFNRPRYQVLKEDVLRAGDELIITEVDRLGRNKQETLKELQYYHEWKLCPNTFPLQVMECRRKGTYIICF